MRVAFIDDEEENRRQWLEWGLFHKHTVKAFEDVFTANQWRADIYVFDISALCPMLDQHSAYSPICALMEDHPGAVIVIGSAVGYSYAENVLDDVERVSGTRPKYFDAARGFDGLDELMVELTAELETKKDI